MYYNGYYDCFVFIENRVSWVCILLVMDNGCLLISYTSTCFFILYLSVITGSAFVLVFLPHGTWHVITSGTD